MLWNRIAVSFSPSLRLQDDSPFAPMNWLSASVSATVLVAIPTAAQIHALGPGHDINNSVNLGASLLIDWEGDGATDLVGLDTTSSRLIRASLTLGPFPSAGASAFIRDLEPTGNGLLLLAELDGSPGSDLVLIEDDSALVWTSSGRAVDPNLSPDLLIGLPPDSSSLTGRIGIADFDGDGLDDLLLSGPTVEQLQSAAAYAAGRIVFALGTANMKVVDLPDTGLSQTRMEIEPAWLPGGAPTVSITGSSGSQLQKVIIGFDENQSPAEHARFAEGPELPRSLVELDGVGPPERLSINSEIDDSTTPATVRSVLRVEQRVGESWEEFAEIPIGPGTSYYFSSVQIDDFDGDGSQEAILEASAWTNTPEAGRLLLLDATGAAMSLQLTALDESITSPRATALPGGGGSVLLSTVASVPVYDALGNPTSIAGLGSRTTLRQFPLEAEDPGDFPVILQNPVSALAVGRLNADGLPDLAILRSVFAVAGVAGPIGPSTTLQVTPPFQEDVSAEIHLVDLTGDGLDDAVISRDGGVFWRRTTVGGSGQVQFVSGGTIFEQSGAPTAPTRVLGDADLDLDGDTDLLVLEGVGATVAWYENRGLLNVWHRHQISLARSVPGWYPVGGLFAGLIPVETRWPDRENTRIADVDGDGDFDFVSIPSALGNRATLHRNTPVGFSLEPLTEELNIIVFGQDPFPGTLPLQADLLHGSFTSSGPEFALAIPGEADALGNPAPVVRFIGDGNSPSDASTKVHLFSPVSKVTAADFDRDGFADMIAAGGMSSDALGNPTGSTRIEWLRSNGDGTFASPVALADPRGFCSFLEAVDLNGDSFPELISASEFTRTIEVFPHENLEPIPPFPEWIATFGVSEMGSDDDPDRDGKPNIFEYLDGTRPDNSDRQTDAPIVPRFQNYYRSPFAASASISRPRQSDGSAQQVDLERSSDLSGWIRVENPPAITIDPAFPLWETLTWSIPYPNVYSEPTRFHRFSAGEE